MVASEQNITIEEPGFPGVRCGGIVVETRFLGVEYRYVEGLQQ